jgi:hypothetical protein
MLRLLSKCPLAYTIQVVVKTFPTRMTPAQGGLGWCEADVMVQGAHFERTYAVRDFGI